MPVMLTTQAEWVHMAGRRDGAGAGAAKPFPAERMAIVATGQRQDAAVVTARWLATKRKELGMAKIHYRIVQHDGGWAYKLDDVFSEPFPSRGLALAAAKRVAQEQQVAGETTHIEYEDEHGVWHSEIARGNDRPDADVIP